jgi:hypothetical protein
MHEIGVMAWMAGHGKGLGKTDDLKRSWAGRKAMQDQRGGVDEKGGGLGHASARRSIGQCLFLHWRQFVHQNHQTSHSNHLD